MPVAMKRTLAFIGAVVLCPCHLPIWAALLAGTALGTFLTQNLTWLFVGFSVAFLLALSYALRLLHKGPV
ncbi:mercury resistance protein [Candidatus Acetothermia bacterium]|nr:mercury resistance protein [Candidatus Acetothermia bacterium]